MMLVVMSWPIGRASPRARMTSKDAVPSCDGPIQALIKGRPRKRKQVVKKSEKARQNLPPTRKSRRCESPLSPAS
jgi:hypothetical protein